MLPKDFSEDHSMSEWDWSIFWGALENWLNRKDYLYIPAIWQVHKNSSFLKCQNNHFNVSFSKDERLLFHTKCLKYMYCLRELWENVYLEELSKRLRIMWVLKVWKYWLAKIIWPHLLEGLWVLSFQCSSSVGLNDLELYNPQHLPCRKEKVSSERTWVFEFSGYGGRQEPRMAPDEDKIAFCTALLDNHWNGHFLVKKCTGKGSAFLHPNHCLRYFSL